MLLLRQAPKAEVDADIEFVLVVAGGHDLNDECMFEVRERDRPVKLTTKQTTKLMAKLLCRRS